MVRSLGPLSVAADEGPLTTCQAAEDTKVEFSTLGPPELLLLLPNEFWSALSVTDTMVDLHSH